MKVARGDRARAVRPAMFHRVTPLDLAALAARLPPRPLTRYAPSPTGYLHLGHVANAVWVWGLARALGGRVLLRLEDHDRGRCRPGYETALLEDLDWLGLEPDLGTPAELRAGPSLYPPERRGTPPTRPRSNASAARPRCSAAIAPARTWRWSRATSSTRRPGMPAAAGRAVWGRRPGRGVRLRDRARRRALRGRATRGAGAGPVGPVRRPAAAGPAGPVDLPVRGGRGRPAARRGSRRPGGGSARVHRPSDPARAAARTARSRRCSCIIR